MLYIAESAASGDVHTVAETLSKDEAIAAAKGYVGHLTPSERRAASVVVLGYDVKLESIDEWKHCTDEDAENNWEDWREGVLSQGAVDVVEIDCYRINQPQHSPYHPEVFGTLQDAVDDADWRIPDYIAEYDDDMDDDMGIEILDKHGRVVAVRHWNAAAKKYDDWRLY